MVGSYFGGSAAQKSLGVSCSCSCLGMGGDYRILILYLIPHQAWEKSAPPCFLLSPSTSEVVELWKASAAPRVALSVFKELKKPCDWVSLSSVGRLSLWGPPTRHHPHKKISSLQVVFWGRRHRMSDPKRIAQYTPPLVFHWQQSSLHVWGWCRIVGIVAHVWGGPSVALHVSQQSSSESWGFSIHPPPN